MNPLLNEALAAGRGILARRDHPELAGPIDAARRRGQLKSVLTGVYAQTDTAARLDIRCRAVAVADPDAVVAGSAAALLHGWDEVDEPLVICAASNSLRDRIGFEFERRTIPARLVRRLPGVRITSRALTAVDLVPQLGSAIIDQALRRKVPLDELHQALALTPNRPGNRLRREVLADSRDRPWSPAERASHRALRGHGVRGWVANYAVISAAAAPVTAYCDIAFPRLKLAIGIDGDAHHASKAANRRDRLRDQELARLGWQVVRVSAHCVMADPDDFVALVRDLVRVRARQLGVPVE